MQPATVFEIPRLRAFALHAVPHLVEATFVPLIVFYLAIWTVGIWGALAAALVWSYGALVRRAVTGRRIPGILAIGAALLTIRTIIALASGSVFIYFLQPTLGTVVVAGAFLVSVPAGRPLAERLAADFLPIPPELLARPYMRRFFIRISLLWAFVNLTNAAVTIWLLVTTSIATFVVAKTFVSLGATATAIGLSTWWFLRSMRRHGVEVRFGMAESSA
jgi:intracellular septation protein A